MITIIQTKELTFFNIREMVARPGMPHALILELKTTDYFLAKKIIENRYNTFLEDSGSGDFWAYRVNETSSKSDFWGIGFGILYEIEVSGYLINKGKIKELYREEQLSKLLDKNYITKK